VVAVLGVLEVAEPDRSLLPGVVPLIEPVAEPEAPMEVPLPVSVEVLLLAVASVLGAVGVAGIVLAVLLVVSLGEVEGMVLEVEVSLEVDDSLLQAPRDRVRAAITAKAAHCAIGDLIIRNSLRGFVSGCIGCSDSVSRCLRLTLVITLMRHVVWRCRTL
jgi:hypothetical protein